MTDLKQQKSNGLFEGNIVKIVSTASLWETIGGPYMLVQNFQTVSFDGIIVGQN
jgi:hypothetical protein